jgi:cytochrome c peroxidase
MAPKSPYRNGDGTMTAQALAGKAIFTSRGCAACHAGTVMTVSGDASQLKNIGTITPASGKRLNGPLAGIDVPTLRGIWRTGPYLHNGSKSLEGAVRAHSGLAVSDTEMPALLRYLQEIEQEP